VKLPSGGPWPSSTVWVLVTGMFTLGALTVAQVVLDALVIRSDPAVSDGLRLVTAAIVGLLAVLSRRISP
jgi:hypothetical protein